MAYRRKSFARRRRPRTHWAQPPKALSRYDEYPVVVQSTLENLVSPGAATPSGTLAAPPEELTEEADSGGGVKSSLEENHPRETVLRVVGMLRPVAVRYENEAETFSVSQASEVRYAIVRINTLRETSAFGVLAANPTGLTFQPDLFSPMGLGSECIAFMRSFILPTLPDNGQNPFGINDALMLHWSIMQTLPWHKNAELSVLDLQSKRKATLNSKMYLLRQVRRWDAHYIDPARILGAILCHADFARVLLGGGSGS